jgi:hypothetical protein
MLEEIFLFFIKAAWRVVDEVEEVGLQPIR